MIINCLKQAKYIPVIGVVFLAGCAASPHDVGPALPPAEAAVLYTTSDYQVSYSWIRKNIFKGCNYCHPNQKANMFTYDGIRQLVMPGNPEQSLLYKKIYSGQMPPGSMHLKKSDVQVVYDWIKQGAMNN
jgi:hypothetical protein